MSQTRESRFTTPDRSLLSPQVQEFVEFAGEYLSNGNARPRRPARRPTPPPAAEAPAASNGHDANGQFTKGNRGGPGNPYNRQIAEFRKQFLAASTPAVFRQVVEALIAKALSGDAAALKLYFQYVMGKPAEAVDPDRVDFDECDVLSQTHASGKLPWHEILQLPYLETMLELVRILRPASDARYRKHIGGGVRALDAQNAKKRQRAEAQRARREAQRAAPTNDNAPMANGGNGAVAGAQAPASAQPDCLPGPCGLSPGDTQNAQPNLAPDRDDAAGVADRVDHGPIVPDAAAHQAPSTNGGNGRAAKKANARGNAAPRSPVANGGNGRGNTTGAAATHKSPIANGENGTRKGRVTKTKAADGDTAEPDPPSANGV